MKRFTDVVVDFFEDENWPVLHTDPGTLETAFEGSTSAWPCRAHVFDDDYRMVFVSAFPELVSESRRAAVGEYCHRANFGLAIGNFELDYDGGEVRFRTSIDGEGSIPDNDHIRGCIVANVLTMDRYFPGLLAVLRDVDPAEAVDAIESLADLDEDFDDETDVS